MKEATHTDVVDREIKSTNLTLKFKVMYTCQVEAGSEVYFFQASVSIPITVTEGGETERGQGGRSERRREEGVGGCLRWREV